MSNQVPVLRFKIGFEWTCYTPGGARLLAALDALAQRLGMDVTLTAGTNDHVPPDVHAFGNAFDVSVSGWTVGQIHSARDFLQKFLGPLFTVLYECPETPSDPILQQIAYVNVHATAPHFHCQVRKLMVFPPSVAPETQPRPV